MQANDGTSATATKRGGGRSWIGLAVAAGGLWWLWGGARETPVAIAALEPAPVISSRSEAAEAPIGARFWLEGEVRPADASAPSWKGRFAYRIAAGEKDEWGAWNEVVRKEVRPEAAFVWAGGELAIPADSYDLRKAPAAPGRGLFTVSERNTGFRPGDEAVAIATKGGDGSWIVESLALGPAAALESRQAGKRRFISGLILAMRLAATALLLAVGVGALFPRSRRAVEPGVR